MAKDPVDTLERKWSSQPPGLSTRPDTPSVLPSREPQPSLEQQRASLQEALTTLEDTFRYMGTGHPDYVSTQRRVQQLRALLAEMDKSAPSRL